MLKRMICLLLCMILMIGTAFPAYADETEGSQNGETTSASVPSEHVCSFTTETITTEATCTAPGIKTLSCSCGESKTEEIAAKGHDYYVSRLDDANHESVCSRCGDKATSTHSWNEGTVTTQANCQQAGVKTYTCTGCGATKTEDIPKKTTHDFGEWQTTATTHSRECKDCLVPEHGNHSFKEEITKQPTCKEDGSKKKYCSVCGYSETIVLTKLTTHTYDHACDPECNVCGRQREIEHTFTKTWSKDHKGHWHECTKCEEKADFSKHIAGPAATEEYDQVCTVCSYIITAKKVHQHTYEAEWTSDKVGHWHACTGRTCTMEDSYAAHDYDDDCDPDCNTCGYERENNHTYDTDGWKTTNFEHWNICSTCGEESKHEKHVAGPEATDDSAQVCTVCNYELAPKLEHVHDFGNVYFSMEDEHWQSCNCGEKSVPEPHIWKDTGKNGKKTVTYECVLCGAEKTESVSSGFPWLTVLLVILALICIGGIAVLVFMLKRGNFDEEDDGSQEELTDEEDIAEENPEDEEDKMIDDYFASLEDEQYK